MCSCVIAKGKKKRLRKVVHGMILINSYWLSGRFKGKDEHTKMLNMMTLKPLMNSGEKKNLKGFLKVLLNRSIFPAKILETCHGRYGLVSQEFIQDAVLTTLQVNLLILNSVFPLTATQGEVPAKLIW